jgi:hypothetical protein
VNLARAAPAVLLLHPRRLGAALGGCRHRRTVVIHFSRKSGLAHGGGLSGRTGHDLAVEYRVNGGPVRQAVALPAPRIQNSDARLFRALLPGQPPGLVEFLPVLRFGGQLISPRLAESAERSRYQPSTMCTS